MLVLKLLTSLVLALLPLAVLIRDWKFHDKRTKLHHNITRNILVIWFVGSVAAVTFVWHETSRSSQLDAKVDELVDGKNELLHKIKTYQADLMDKQKTIDRLEVEAAKARRGISISYDFWGNSRKTGAVGTVLETGGGHRGPVVKQMYDLHDQRLWPDLISLCEKQLVGHPEWLTPYFFMAVGYANQGNRPKTIELLEHVQTNAPDDTEYAEARRILQTLKKQ